MAEAGAVAGPRSWWVRIPDFLKTTASIGAVALAVYGFGKFRGAKEDIEEQVPARLEAVELANRRQDAAIDTLRAELTDGLTDFRGQLDRILCFVEAQSGVKHVAECIR